MSDQTPPEEGAAPEEPARPRRESLSDRRASETVMLNSDSVKDIVAQAKAGAAPEDVAPAAEPVTPPQPAPVGSEPAAAEPPFVPQPAAHADPVEKSGPNVVLLVVGVLVLVAAIVAIVIVLASR